MRNLTVSEALSILGGMVRVNGKNVVVTTDLGLKSLGALDFLKLHGYTVSFNK